MNEETKLILTLFITIIGIPTAIFSLWKAYIELRKALIEWHNRRKGTSKGDTELTEVSTNTNIQNNPQTTISTEININTAQPPNDNYSEKCDIDIINDNLILKDQYTSLFAENGEVHSERIIIRKSEKGLIEGDVYLDDNCTYKLTGTYKNKVLTGEYSSVGNYLDERGTINLRLISENILSGFCTFSKTSVSTEDQIRMSPYVWVAGDDKALVNGTYEFCTKCHNERRQCCCASNDIDMPILMPSEARKLQSLNPRNQKMQYFSRAIGSTSIRQMNSLSNSSSPVYCHFYDPHDNKCKIYDNRPTDCRLFPFDIKLDSNTNEYWVGYYSDLCIGLPDEETMKIYAHILRPQLFILFPYANTINRDDVCEHLSKATFEKLYKLHQFIF